MHIGMIPYKDLFDHKGIILYFIEYIGYIIGFGSRIGVWIIELFNMFVSTIIFYHLAKLFSSSRISCYAVVFVVTSLCSFSFFEGGNLVEEYALPWISLSLYFVIKFFISNKYKKWNVVIIGCGFSVVILLRANMVGLWGALLLAVAFYFIKKKRVSDLLKCVLLFILGALIIFIPTIIYLWSTNSIAEMIDYYIKFNLLYTGSHSRKGITTFIFDCLSAAGISSFFVVYSLLINYKNKIIWLNFITLLFAYLSAAISGRSYLHYGIILIPFFVIPAVYTIIPFLEKTKEISFPIKRKSVITLISLVCLLCMAVNPAVYIKNNINVTNNHNPINDYLSANTTEKDDVLVLGNNVSTYISSDRQTKNKFFYQNPPIDVSDKLYQEFISELESNQSDYIINQYARDSSYSEQESETITNHQKVIEYLNNECEKGIYVLEEYENFQVYVRKLRK